MATVDSYYVPDQSKLPLVASIGLFLTVFGAANSMMSASLSPILWLGLAVFIATLWVWFATAITENQRGLNSEQLKRSYVWGMGWFIFSEFMFFAAFFGALYYIRAMTIPELGTDETLTNEFLWPEFEANWPLMTTPDMAQGVNNPVTGPGENMSFPGWSGIAGWLPFWNTAVLLTSSFTVHFAHTALKKDNRKNFNLWLGITVLLGFIFVGLQAAEYVHAYDVNLTLTTGAYGNTFFILTGFHGLHVIMGTTMLLIMWLRSVLKNHFNHDDCFGFEAASWYWHFVDVVWVGLFLFVYVFS